MIDHDQRFKILIQSFFGEFFEILLPEWARRFDFSHIEWLDKEVFVEPPSGERVAADIVAKLSARERITGSEDDEPWLALIHIEIEGRDSAAELRRRMFEYFWLLHRKYDLPVLPVALLIRVGYDGIGREVYAVDFWELPVLRFEYLYVGLPALTADESHVAKDKKDYLRIALSAFMKTTPEYRRWLATEGLRTIVHSPLKDQEKFLLCDCINVYLPQSVEDRTEAQRILNTEPYKETQMRTASWFDQGVEVGIEKGIEKGERALIRMQLEKRFGALDENVLTRLENLARPQIEVIAGQLLDGRSLKEMGLAD